MIRSLLFRSFRGFTDLKISSLKRVNLIAGANNTGKTGLLEGLYLLFGDASQIPFLPSVFRTNVSGYPNQPTSDDFYTFWESLFHDKDTDVTPMILAELRQGDQNSCELQKPHGASDILIRYGCHELAVSSSSTDKRPGFRVAPHGTPEGSGKNPFNRKLIVLSTRLEHPTRDADLFNQVSLLEGGEERLVLLLREIDVRLQKLRYLKAPGTHQALVYAHFGLKNAISMTQTGQGFSKLFSLFCQMLISKAEFLFIDEIENGLYYESLPTIWKGISALAKSENIQVFATTHSRECIVAAHETFSAMPDYDFALHRLQTVQGKVEVVTHDRQMLDVAIKSGLEVR